MLAILGFSLLPLVACRETKTTTKVNATPIHRTDSTTVQGSDTTLVGKRLYLEFESNISVVEYLSDQHLFWLSRDSIHGTKEGKDFYNSLHIEPHVFFVNWVERDGTTVSQVLDLRARTCQAFLTSNIYSPNKDKRVTVVLSGKISRIEETVHISSSSSPSRQTITAPAPLEELGR